MNAKHGLVVVLALLLAGCEVGPPQSGAEPPATSAPPPAPPPPPPATAPSPPRDGPPRAALPPAAGPVRPAKPDYAVVRTFYATDRRSLGQVNHRLTFDGKRGELSYGVAEVSIPNDHKVGELEAPSIWRLEFSEDPVKHVVLLSTIARPRADFFRELGRRVSESRGRNAFIFIHGYNVTFEDAARRTAQIAYDLQFDGAPVFYSWPSQGETASYTIDEQNMEWTQANLKIFLTQFFADSAADNVYLVAHSMGNRALTRALGTLLTESPGIRGRVKEVILTAPDIDAAVFKRDIAPALVAAGRPITLYASAEDKALAASKLVHGEPRLGDAGPSLVIMPGIETIDATGVDTTFLGHSHVATKSVLSDMFYMFRHSLRASQRSGLRRRQGSDGPYWVFME